MARFITGNTFGATDTVTSTTLNDAVNNAKISTDSVDGSTIELNSDALRLKDAGITTAKILDSNVTKAKIENVANMKALGNTSGSATAPQEVAILDEDTMSSNSATSLATQQSIKAYANGTVSAATNGYVILPNGLIMQWGQFTDADIAHGESFSVVFASSGGIAFPTALLQIHGFPNDNAVPVTNSGMAAFQRITASSTTGFTAQVGSFNGSNMNMTYKWNAIGH